MPLNYGKVINFIGDWTMCFYSCGVSTAIIEYPCPSLCLCLSARVHNNSKHNGSINLKLKRFGDLVGCI